MSALFLKGFAFGFVLAGTVGPMWVLCFRRTLHAGALAGFAYVRAAAGARVEQPALGEPVELLDVADGAGLDDPLYALPQVHIATPLAAFTNPRAHSGVPSA